MKRLLGTVLAFSIGAVAAADAPPPAPSRPATDTIYGVDVADPYRNLEDQKNPETRAWMKAQGDYAAGVLARIEGRDAMMRRIDGLGRAAGSSIRGVTRMPGGRVYYLRRLAGESQYRLVLRQGAGGAERVLVDPEALTKATGVPHALNYFVPSWDGAMLAYGISAGGSEDASLYVLDIASGKPLLQPISRVHESLVSWAPDSRVLTFNQVRELPAGADETETFLEPSSESRRARQARSRFRCSARWSIRRSSSTGSTSAA